MFAPVSGRLGTVGKVPAGQQAQLSYQSAGYLKRTARLRLPTLWEKSMLRKSHGFEVSFKVEAGTGVTET